MSFVIVIPSYESKDLLDLNLSTILSQAGGVLDVIVVDSSQGGVDPRIKAKFPKVRFIETHRQLLAGAARNLGASQSKADWLIFLDADCVWTETWWHEANRLISLSPEIDAFIGKIFSDAIPGSWSHALHIKEFHEFLGDKYFEPRFVSSGNLLIKRAAFEAAGGFPESIPMCQDFCFLDRSSGRDFKTWYSPLLSIRHRDHLTDEQKIKEKVKKMGYWRGRVDHTLSPKLRLPFWISKLDRISLGICFSATVFNRLFLKSPQVFFDRETPFLKILRLSFIWAGGLHLGLSERTQ